MKYVGSLTGFCVPDDLTEDLLRDALCMYGDVKSMNHSELCKLWHEKGLDIRNAVPELDTALRNLDRSVPRT